MTDEEIITLLKSLGRPIAKRVEENDWGGVCRNVGFVRGFNMTPEIRSFLVRKLKGGK